MRILFVVPYTPTPIRVRPYSFVRFLAQRGHTVILATLWENAAEQAALSQLHQAGIRVIAAPLTRTQKLRNAAHALRTGRPLQAEFCVNPELRTAVLHLLRTEAMDVVHVEHLRGAAYGLAIQQETHLPVIWDSVDCISHLFQQAARQSRSLAGRWMARLEQPKTRAHERWLVRQFPRVLVTSSIDQQALQALVPAQEPALADIRVLANGVDLDYFAPDGSPHNLNTVVYSGKMSYHANVTAALYLARDIMPLVWREQPEAKLIIAGSKPPTSIQRLTDDARITVTGYVEDLRQPLRQATVAVAPLLYGAGIQNKVLEAMACGTPVVATPQAVSALGVQTGQDCLVADTPAALAAAILQVLNSGALRAQLSQRGRQFVEIHHSWHALIAQLERHYQEINRNSTAQSAAQAQDDFAQRSSQQMSIGGEYSDVHKSNPTRPIHSTDARHGAEHAPVATRT